MKRRTLLTAFIVLLPILSGLRIYEMINCIDSANGFFKTDQTAVLYATVLVLFVIAAAVLLLGGRLARDAEKIHTPPKKSMSLAVCSALAGAGILADIAVKIKTDIVDFKAKYNVTEVKDESVIYLMCAVSVIAAVVFFVQSKNFASGKGLSAGITVSLSAWALIRLFVRYTLEFNGLALISENVFDIFALCAIMMALLYVAHIYAGMTPKKSEARLFFFGLIAALFSAVTSVSRIVLLAANEQSALTHSANPSFANLFVTAYIIALLFYMTSKDTVNDAAVFVEDDDDGEDEYKPQFGEISDGETADNGENKSPYENTAQGADRNTAEILPKSADENTDANADRNATENITENASDNAVDDTAKALGQDKADSEEDAVLKSNGHLENGSSQSPSEKDPSFDDFSIESILAEIENRERETN